MYAGKRYAHIKSGNLLGSYICMHQLIMEQHLNNIKLGKCNLKIILVHAYIHAFIMEHIIAGFFISKYYAKHGHLCQPLMNQKYKLSNHTYACSICSYSQELAILSNRYIRSLLFTNSNSNCKF